MLKKDWAFPSGYSLGSGSQVIEQLADTPTGETIGPQIKTLAISDVEGMKKIAHLWDAFISEHGGCPFLLSDFLYQFLKPNPCEFMPYILVFFIDDRIIGVVPLEIRDSLLYRKCTLLQDPWLPVGFVIEPKYAEALLRETFTILFRNMRCLFFDFVVPTKSQYPPVLKQVCEEKGIFLSSLPSNGCAVAPVNKLRDQLEKNRHLKREIERTGRRMRERGNLNIKWFGKGDYGAEVLERILAVERASWKSFNQYPKKFEADKTLLFVLNGCMKVSLTVPAFNWGVAVLELNGKPIAHSIFLEYNGHAYVAKTSFDDRYSKYSPGTYILDAVVHELMSKTGVKVIDFITDLPISHKWASEVVSFNRFLISRNEIGLIYWAENLVSLTIHSKGPKFFNKYLTYVTFILNKALNSRR